EKINEGEITGMFLMCSNPIVSNPNANFVKKALKKLKFLVAVDMFVSETARLADLILPASSYLEDEGTMTNLEGRVTLREASFSSPGEVK
ncbi:molybdopterin-dependent oxidoreductase, partial [Bacillus subtilis]